MRHRLSYLLLSVGIITTMVCIKLWVVPFVLWLLFPQTDLVSRLYEVLIMTFGGISFLLYIVLGYMGKHLFQFGYKEHLVLHLLVQLPFALQAFLQEFIDIDPMGFSTVFANGWCGLIAEPTRLLFMVYPWTDIFAIFASFVFLGIGRKIEIADEGKFGLSMKDRIKVGKM